MNKYIRKATSNCFIWCRLLNYFVHWTIPLSFAFVLFAFALILPLMTDRKVSYLWLLRFFVHSSYHCLWRLKLYHIWINHYLILISEFHSVECHVFLDWLKEKSNAFTSVAVCTSLSLILVGIHYYVFGGLYLPFWLVPSPIVLCFSLLFFCKFIVSDKIEFVNNYFENIFKNIKWLDKLN